MPKHHQFTGNIVVDKRFAHLSHDELLAGINSGEIPIESATSEVKVTEHAQKAESEYRGTASD